MNREKDSSIHSASFRLESTGFGTLIIIKNKNNKQISIKNNQMKIIMKRIFDKTKLLSGLIIAIIVLTISCKKDPVPVTGITLDKTTATVQVGNTLAIQAFINPGDADNKNVTWSSADVSVASVANGVVTGVALGTTTITAASDADPSIKSTCEVIITPSTGQVIQVSGDITENTTWYAGAKYMLSGFVYVKEQCHTDN